MKKTLNTWSGSQKDYEKLEPKINLKKTEYLTTKDDDIGGNKE